MLKSNCVKEKCRFYDDVSECALIRAEVDENIQKYRKFKEDLEIVNKELGGRKDGKEES